MTASAATPHALHLGGGLELPLDVVTRRTAILGQTGTGKTSTAVVMVEEAAAAGARFCVLDPTGAWYGLRSSADGERPGVDCVVMGGEHGDVPLDPGAGAVVARLVAQEGYNPVLCLDTMPSWAARQRFVADFLGALYELSRSQVLVVFDEAHRFAPQQVRDAGGDAARCLGAVIDAVALGRRKGIGVVPITQRLARLHKDVLELCEVLIVHRLRGTNDLKALRGWLEDTDADVRGDLAEVAQLPNGTARVSAPTLGIDGTFAIRPKHTFDSSASIGVGEVAIEPRARANVDMNALRALMADALERQADEDPERLRQRIAELEERLVAQPDTDVEDRAAAAERLLEAERERERWEERARHAETLSREAEGQLRDAGAHLTRLADSLARSTTASPSKAASHLALASPGADSAPAPRRPSSGAGKAPTAPGALGERILATLQERGPQRTADLGVLTGKAANSGYFRRVLATMRDQRLLEAGDPVTLTEQGRTAITTAVVPDAAALLNEWTAQGALEGIAPAQLRELVAACTPPSASTAIPVGALAERVGKSPNAGYFRRGLKLLRSRGLIDGPPDALHPNPALVENPQVDTGA